MSNPFNLAKLDVSILLRAISIFSIVAGHFHWLGIPGGAAYLIYLSGFNFILFTCPKVPNLVNKSDDFLPSEFYSRYFSFLWKLILPTLLYTVFLYTFLGEFYVGGLLMISNFYGPMYANGLTFWFLEVLIQIYLLFAILFYVNKKFFIFKFYPYRTMLISFLFFYIFSVVCRLIWDTSDLLDRLPHLMIYMFFGGALSALSKTNKQKMLTTIAVSIILVDLLLFGWNSRILFLYCGAVITIWARFIMVPYFIKKIVTLCALSSLFIYLTHFQSLSLIQKFDNDISPAYEVLFAFVVGIIIAKLWKSRAKLADYSTKILMKRI